MARQESIARARGNLARLVREAEAGRPVVLTRRGEVVAALVGRRELEQLTHGRRRFSGAFDTFAREVDVSGLGMDPDELFGPGRDRRPGRDTAL
jgi:prevent-host-death family protein